VSTSVVLELLWDLVPWLAIAVIGALVLSVVLRQGLCLLRRLCRALVILVALLHPKKKRRRAARKLISAL